MLLTTDAVVLKTVAHGDRAVVLKAWTSHAGVRSYMVRIGSKKGNSAAALQALNRLQIVVDERPDHDMHHVRELRVAQPYLRLHTDPVRSAVALFVQEVLYRVLRTEAADPALNAYVLEALETIDSAEDLRWFPSVFMLQLSGHFGFFPEEPEEGNDHFDMQDGRFLPGAGPHDHLMRPPLSLAFAQLLRIGLDDLHHVPIAFSFRRELLDHVLLYFRLHVDGLGELRSPAVLHATLA
ncbi:MAG: DNA repair protein RecO C-terminal domain-containing protein [Flavobacteriales bacterium]|nr:DNA repair protein RecO C-terminal domain-containing protein [Flavobacteriales bacterium]